MYQLLVPKDHPQGSRDISLYEKQVGNPECFLYVPKRRLKRAFVPDKRFEYLGVDCGSKNPRE